MNYKATILIIDLSSTMLYFLLKSVIKHNSWVIGASYIIVSFIIIVSECKLFLIFIKFLLPLIIDILFISLFLIPNEQKLVLLLSQLSFLVIVMVM